MLRSFVIAVAMFAVPACVEQPEPEHQDYPLPTGDQCNTLSKPSVELHEHVACAARNFCPIATGGTVRVDVNNPQGWKRAYVVADAPLDVDSVGPYDDVVLHATQTGDATFSLIGQVCDGWDEKVILEERLDIMPVDTVRLRSPSEVFTHDYNPASSDVTFLGDKIGYLADHVDSFIELAPAGAGVTAPKYLIDSSVHLAVGTSTSVEMWNESWLSIHDPGVHPVVLASDAFGTRTFELHAFDHVERFEAHVLLTPTRVGDVGHVCFHAFTETYELELPTYHFQVSGALEFPKGAHDNCREFKATSAGTAKVSVDAFGTTGSIEFTIAP